MSDGSREAYNNWRNGWKALETGAPPVFEIWDTAWKQAWQAARAEYGTTDSKKWRVDDLVQDVNGDIFTIEGFKGDKLLVKDASETLWLTPTDELTWHSRPTKEK